MRIYVVELGGSDEPHAVEYEEAAGCELDSLLYVSVPLHIPMEELDDQLSALRSEWRRAGQLIVLRLHPPAAAELLADRAAVDTLHERFEGLPMLLAHLAPDRSIELTPLEANGAPAYDPAQLLEALRFAELHSWLQYPGVVLPANDHFHYEGPNGCRYESFMRVGTAIQGTETLDAVAFWLQPYLRGDPVVVFDAWTIKSVGLNLHRYAKHAGSPCQPVADVECLGAYDEDMDKLKLRLAAVRDRSPGTPALLVSSVVSMGELHRKLEELVAAAGFDDRRSLALYGRADSEGEVFCRDSAVGNYWRKDEVCPLSTPTVSIAPSTYLVDISVEPKELPRIQVPDARRPAEFFDRYGGGDFLTVHRDDTDRDRHHMIHIDIERLMVNPEFSRRLDAKLKPLSPDVVLAPRYPAAVALAEEVGRRLGVEPIVADERELSRLSPEEQDRLKAAGNILLVDDVVISGARLLGYRNFLRRGDFVSAERPTEIHLLVGVARARDNLKIRGIEDMVDVRNRFHKVETLLLPDWDEPECPWCWELRQLEEFGHEIPLTEKLRQRWERLRNKREGLRDPLFIPWVQEVDDPLPVSAWELGPGSVFHAKSQIDLFVAVASTLQYKRAAGDLDERRRYPLARPLDPDFWLTGRYYDSPILAAILRATRRHDLRTSQIDAELRKAVSERLQNPDLRGELIMATARGHLPIAAETAADGGLLSDPVADPGFAALLERALEGPGYSSSM